MQAFRKIIRPMSRILSTMIAMTTLSIHAGILQRVEPAVVTQNNPAAIEGGVIWIQLFMCLQEQQEAGMNWQEAAATCGASDLAPDTLATSSGVIWIQLFMCMQDEVEAGYDRADAAQLCLASFDE